MIGHALNSSNDFIIEGGQRKTVRDGAEVVQHVRSRLMLFEEEYALDKTQGTPWYQEVFVRPANLRLVESIIKERILGTDGLDRIIEFNIDSFDAQTRKLTISFSAETTYGLIEGETINV